MLSIFASQFLSSANSPKIEIPVTVIASIIFRNNLQTNSIPTKSTITIVIVGVADVCKELKGCLWPLSF